jgi:predicted  nucleic acid-binding Zn-ribbon protein
MSQALASARKRRGVPQNTPDLTPQPRSNIQQPNVNTSGLTLPQIITIVDKRLTNLEQFMKETQEGKTFSRPTVEFKDSESNIVSSESDPDQLTDLNEILDEYNNRFVLLAEEISQMKDIVMKLQTYTMDVNKTLIEERIHILSDLGKQNITIEEEIDEELDQNL